jgi:two-component system, chemotaxis family, chemotaxis protein CheY
MSRTVLIVEDTEQCATTLEIALLGIPDVDVSTARDAAQALLLLDSSGTVSVLITDLHLPIMDGFEFIERMRRDQRYARIPVIVVSGDTDPRTPERVRRLGAEAYFAKPYSPAQVRQKVEELLDARPPQAVR